jgi:16S rRNA processing protein RimM
VSEKWLTVGRLVNTHGIRGEVKVLPSTDFPEERFARGSRLTLHAPDASATVDVEVASAREHKGAYIVKLKGYDNINQVLPYKGWTVKVPASRRVPLAEGEYYFHDIIGCAVVTEEGEEIGRVSEILRPGANDVWVVERPNGRQALIPYIADVVLDVDVGARRVTIRLMEGLI